MNSFAAGKAFAGLEEMLSDFLLEAGDMLEKVDSGLMILEKSPNNSALLDEVFRGFHTIKGGAGFLSAKNLVDLCHLTENLFDKLRKHEMSIDPVLMDVIFAATAEVERMFAELRKSQQPSAAPKALLDNLALALEGKLDNKADTDLQSSGDSHEWQAMFDSVAAEVYAKSMDIAAVVGAVRDEEKIAEAIALEESPRKVFGRRADDKPGDTIGRRGGDVPAKEAKENTIRVDTSRLDQVLNLSGEIGLTKNRLTHLRTNIIQGRIDAETLRELDQSVSQLDMLVVNLQNAVMKTRMQPIGRLFNKYPRLARDLARSLGKNVELELSGEETEMDKTMIEDLNDPLVHLVRNAVDHGVETKEERAASGKPEKSIVELNAHQEGDHIVITIKDDGKGMRPDVIRSKAVSKGLISAEVANTLNDDQSLELIFLPGFSTKDEISSVSGRGVGMDVVKTNISKLNGTISIQSAVGVGSVFAIALPLTLAILPVLILRLAEQSFAVPLSMVREIIPLTPGQIQQVSGRATIVVRGEVLPVLPLSKMIGWPSAEKSPEVGVMMQLGSSSFVLAADGFSGHDDVVIKSLDTFKPKGVAGVTMSSEGDIVLILDVKELLSEVKV